MLFPGLKSLNYFLPNDAIVRAPARGKLSQVRVVHMSSAHPANDVRVFLKECCSLQVAGYEVHLVAKADEDRLEGGVHIHAIYPFRSRIARMGIGTLLVLVRSLKVRPAIFHFHDPELIPIGIILWLLGKKVIFDVHEDGPRDIVNRAYLPGILKSPVASIMERFERFAARHFAAVIAATPSISMRFQGRARRLAVVNNYPILDEFTCSKGLPYDERPPNVVYLGAIAVERGILENVKALDLVDRKWNVKLELAGAFSSIEDDAAARALPGWSRVLESGQVGRIRIGELLGSARAGLVLFHPLANHVNAQPNKLFEYMAAGLPVIASDFPLWREIVQESRCGLLVNPMDPAAIAGAIEWLLEHPREAEEMGSNGRMAVETRFNWLPEEKQLFEIYSEVLAD